jgi:hypothetical protein
MRLKATLACVGATTLIGGALVAGPAAAEGGDTHRHHAQQSEKHESNRQQGHQGKGQQGQQGKGQQGQQGKGQQGQQGKGQQGKGQQGKGQQGKAQQGQQGQQGQGQQGQQGKGQQGGRHNMNCPGNFKMVSTHHVHMWMKGGHMVVGNKHDRNGDGKLCTREIGHHKPVVRDNMKMGN